MYINNNNNKRYHRNRETIYTSDTCIHDRSLYWSGTCTLIIIIIKDIIESFSVSVISFIIIIINVHVPDQYSERSCIHVSEVLIVIKIKDIIETEKQSIPLTHVYMTVHCTGLVHVHDIFYYYYY
jgi:hypothetical protein